jgi:hypothetical protein
VIPAARIERSNNASMLTRNVAVRRLARQFGEEPARDSHARTHDFAENKRLWSRRPSTALTVSSVRVMPLTS